MSLILQPKLSGIGAHVRRTCITSVAEIQSECHDRAACSGREPTRSDTLLLYRAESVVALRIPRLQWMDSGHSPDQPWQPSPNLALRHPSWRVGAEQCTEAGGHHAVTIRQPEPKLPPRDETWLSLIRSCSPYSLGSCANVPASAAAIACAASSGSRSRWRTCASVVLRTAAT
jgi:hypothetical protein